MEQRKNSLWAMCLIATAVCSIYSFVLNSQVIAVLSVSAPVARDVVYGLKLIPLFAIAFFLPRLLSSNVSKRLTIASGMLALLGCALMFAASAVPANATQFTIGAFAALCLGGTWFSALPLLLLCGLKSFESVASCSIASYVLSSVGSVLLASTSSEINITLLAILPCVVLLLSHTTTQEYAKFSEGSDHIRELELRNLRSFASFDNPAFICIFVFHCVSGFALALNCISGVPIHSVAPTIFVIAFALVAFVRAKQYSAVDSLAGIAAFFVVGGLLIALALIDQAPVLASNIALSTGSDLLLVLEMLIIASMGSRSPLGALRVIALSKMFSSAGTLVGSASGHFINEATAANQLVATSSIALILFVFLVLCYIWLRRYSFEKLIFAIEPPLPVEPPSAPPEELQLKCEAAGKKYGLTKREIEICRMLASGMGGKEIEQTCVISYNTVKTHVKHIYTKLDVHSQQELIGLISAL